MNMKKTLLSIPVIFLLPMVAAAQGGGLAGGQAAGTNSFGAFIQGLTVLVNTFLIPFFIALCVLGFIWGVYKFFIMGSSDEDKRSEGRQLMLYAFIGFVAIVALWGIVGFLVSAFGFAEDTGSLRTPSGPSTGG